MAIDIFVDLTNRYYGTVGGTANDCLEMVDFSFTAINMLYMRDGNLINRIGRVSIRQNLNQDPYKDAGNDMALLRSIVAVEDNPWVSGPNSATDHDLGTVIQTNVGGGIAIVRGIGTGSSANGGRTLGDFSGAGRHEWGHNWGLNHFDGRGEGELLSPEGKTINSGNGLAKMSAPELELALQERDRRTSVLTNLGTTAPDMPPRAADDILEGVSVLTGQKLIVRPLANDNDSNGESLSIVAVDSASNLGASVSLNNNTNAVTITVPGSYAFGYDFFRYQISDESGRTSTAVVHLMTSPAQAEFAVTPVPANGDSLLMIASDKFEGNGDTLEYFFEHVNGSVDSGWQTSSTYVASGLPAGEAQTFRVYARVRGTSSVSLPSESASGVPFSVGEGNLFADTFNRTFLNGDSGQSGMLPTLGYSVIRFGDVIANNISNQLHIDGPAGSDTFGALFYIDNFNFGAPLMRDFDQVSIKVDIAGYSTVGSSRQMWLAIGQSLSEVEGQSGANPGSSPGDLVVAYRRTTNTLEIYKNGTLINAETVSGNLPAPPTEMRIVYNSPSLLEGTEVAYSVYLDGRSVPHTSGTFSWSGDYQNYISLGANLSEDALFDNLAVEVETTPGFTPPPLVSFQPVAGRKYYMDSPSNNLRIAATGVDIDPFTTSTSTTGSQVEWEFVPNANGSWHIQLAEGDGRIRLRTRGSGVADMATTASSGIWTYYDLTPGALADTSFVTLPDQSSNVSRLQVGSDGSISFVSESLAGDAQSIRFTEVPDTDPVSLTFTPDPDKTYYIENPAWGYRLAANGDTHDAFTVPITDDALNAQWKFVERSPGLWHIDLVIGGEFPRIRTDNTPIPDMNVGTAVGTLTYYEITPSDVREGTFHLTLPEAPVANQRLRILPDGSLNFTTVSNPGASESLRFVEVSVPTDYDNWAAAQSVSNLGSADDDYDNDGLSNNEERVWGLDPASASSNNPYARQLDETGTFQYTRRNPDLTGLTFSIWSSTDLVDWSEDLGATQTSTQSAADAEVQTVDVTLDRYIGADAVFIRIQASE